MRHSKVVHRTAKKALPSTQWTPKMEQRTESKSYKIGVTRLERVSFGWSWNFRRRGFLLLLYTSLCSLSTAELTNFWSR